MNRVSPEPLWTPIDVATYLGVPVQTLYQWRRKGFGPPARRIGRHLRYEPNAVRAQGVGKVAGYGVSAG